jgi:hypothetical protein
MEESQVKLDLADEEMSSIEVEMERLSTDQISHL